MFLVTHDDIDHSNSEAIAAIVGSDTDIIIIYDTIDAAGLQWDTGEVKCGESTTLRGIQVGAEPAYNRSDGDQVYRDEGSFPPIAR